MKNLQRVRTRRQLFRVTAVAAASIPLLALTRNTASAQTALTPAQTATYSGIPEGRLPIKGDKDFDTFRRSSGAGTANWR